MSVDPVGLAWALVAIVSLIGCVALLSKVSAEDPNSDVGGPYPWA